MSTTQRQDGATYQKALTERQLQERWQKSHSSIWRMEKEGLLKPIRLTGGRSKRYLIEDIENVESAARNSPESE